MLSFKVPVSTAARFILGARAGVRSRPGLLAAAAALVAQWLVRRIAPEAPFAPYSVANRVVRVIPGDVATQSIEMLGHHALDLAAAASLAGALGLGFAAGRRTALPFGIMALALSLAAFAADPVHPSLLSSLASAAIAALAAAAIVAFVLPQPVTAAGKEMPSPSRRRVLGAAALALGFSGLGGAAALRSLKGSGVRGLVRADRSVEVNGDPRFDAMPGLTPRTTPTASHYVVDSDLTDPFLSASSWRLKVAGEVSSPLTLSLADLRSMNTVEQAILMQCISNPVGGALIGNARWTGVPLRDILAQAGASERATTVSLRAADGYSETVPIEIARAGDVLVVFGINGRLLPVEHGYPARVIFPGRYGMRSVKWATSIEVTNAPADGYWEKRGWDREAVMRTGARFDLPRPGATVRSPLTAAGLAYAGDRGVSAVEVSSDDGQTWQRTTLEAAAGPLAWRRWAIDLALPPGDVVLTVRSVDSSGEIQDSSRRSPHPDGASGYHRIVVTSL